MENLIACLLTPDEYQVLLAMRQANAAGFLRVEKTLLELILEEISRPLQEIIVISSDDESDLPEISDLMGKLLSIIVFFKANYFPISV
jgi:hypothetical protein